MCVLCAILSDRNSQSGGLQMKSFGAFLKYTRKNRQLTQDQVAEKLHIVTPVLSKWENDKAMPSLEMLCKLCNVLDLSLEDCIAAEKTQFSLPPPADYDAKKVGCAIKDLRIKNGWSQSEVGKKLFVTSQTVSKWENGGVTSLETLKLLTDIYAVTPTALFNGTIGQMPAATQTVPAAPAATPTTPVAAKNNKFIIKCCAIAVAVILLLIAVGWGIYAGVSGKFSSDEKEEPAVTNTLFISPVNGAVYRGHNDFYVDALFGSFTFHDGLDFEADIGTEVYAVANGTIESISATEIRLDCGNGLTAIYIGVLANENLSEGMAVVQGDTIATVCKQDVLFESADGDHLHFQVLLNGESVNPADYILQLAEIEE